MPVITVASIKGGTGKTTVTLALASEIRSGGGHVHLLDTDPELSLFNWYQDWEAKDGITVENGAQIHHEQIERHIEALSKKYPYVIIDVEGRSNDVLINAAAAADLMIIPQRASALDLERTNTLIKKLKWIQGAREGRPLPFRVLITQRQAAISSNPEREVLRQVVEALPRFDAELFAVEAFRSMFLYRKTLEEVGIEKIANVLTARASAGALLVEVFNLLEEIKNDRSPG